MSAVRKFTRWVTLLWLAGVLAHGQAQTREVLVDSNVFQDSVSNTSTSTINSGDTIRWVWGSGTHTTTSGTCTLPSGPCNSDGLWNATIASPGQTFERVFNSAGTFPYYCAIHGVMMRGTIVVQTSAASTTTTVASAGSPSAVGASVTFSATVTSGGGTPAGNVTFKSDGSALGPAVALNGQGAAALSTSALTAGSHSITAEYAGNASFSASTSTAITQVVKINTTTALQSSLNPSIAGQAVTFTATVSNTGAVATGSVSFRDNDVEIGTGTLDLGGVATFQTSALSAGSHPITVVYAGSAVHFGSASSAVNQVVNPATGNLTFAPGALDFGAVAVKRSSGVKSVTLTNTMANAASLSSLQVGGEYAQTSDCGSSLSAGANCTINIVLTPQAVGMRTGQLTLDGANPVTLTGSGVDFTFPLTRPARPPRH